MIEEDLPQEKSRRPLLNHPRSTNSGPLYDRPIGNAKKAAAVKCVNNPLESGDTIQPNVEIIIQRYACQRQAQGEQLY